MTTAPRRRLSREQRREVIEAAAERLLAERGFAGTRMADVAAEAGISRQLLLRHFATKAELHTALLERHRDGLLAIVRERPLDADADPQAQIRIALAAWFSYLERHPFAARLLFEDTTGRPEIAALHRAMREDARQAISAALRANPAVDVPEADLEPVAEMLRAATVALAVWWSDHPETAAGQLVDLAAAMWRRVLGDGRRD